MNSIKYFILYTLKKSSRTALWLLKIILPISLLVRFLDYFGILTYIAQFLDPMFMHLGLPGSTAIIFITSIFLPLYAPLAIITSMSVTLRELTILALMCQISHNLPVESAIQSKTGTPFWQMFFSRIFASIIVGLILNLILPRDMGMPFFNKTDAEVATTIGGIMMSWFESSVKMTLLIFAIITSLNILYRLLEQNNLIPKLSNVIKPLLRFWGLPESVGFLWLIGYIVGLAYGGAMMIDQMNEGKISRSDAKLLNYHLAMSHSVIEDNLIFVVLGVSFWWILGVRLTAAWIAVWAKRLVMRLSIRRATLS